MKSARKKVVIAAMIACIAGLVSYAETVSDAVPATRSVEFGPDGDIFFVQYGRALSPSDEIVFGAVYLDSTLLDLLDYPGEERLVALEAGYRRYLLAHLHVEVDILPQYVAYRDDTTESDGGRFGLAGEVRVGYRFDFRLFNAPLFLRLQWFAGYYLANPKPESFIAVDGGSFYTSFVPMFLLGCSW